MRGDKTARIVIGGGLIRANFAPATPYLEHDSLGTIGASMHVLERADHTVNAQGCKAANLSRSFEVHIMSCLCKRRTSC